MVRQGTYAHIYYVLCVCTVERWDAHWFTMIVVIGRCLFITALAPRYWSPTMRRIRECTYPSFSTCSWPLLATQPDTWWSQVTKSPQLRINIYSRSIECVCSHRARDAGELGLRYGTILFWLLCRMSCRMSEVEEWSWSNYSGFDGWLCAMNGVSLVWPTTSRGITTSTRWVCECNWRRTCGAWRFVQLSIYPTLW